MLHPHPPAAAAGASRPLGLFHHHSRAAHSPCSPHRLAAAHQQQQRPVRHATQRQQRHPQQQLRAFADGGEGHPSDGRLDSGDELASEFAQHINLLSLKAPLQHRRPSPLDPPTAAVAAQMDAMQINDWPEPDAGVHTAVRPAPGWWVGWGGVGGMVSCVHVGSSLCDCGISFGVCTMQPLVPLRC
jgi:hypothetical protein